MFGKMTEQEGLEGGERMACRFSKVGAEPLEQGKEDCPRELAWRIFMQAGEEEEEEEERA